jgi:thymidylate kinase
MVHPVLKDVFRDFKKLGLCWCLLRLPAALGTPTGGDIDLLVSRIDLEAVGRVLECRGFARVPSSPKSAHNHFLTYHPPTDCWMWLDIVTELSFGPSYVLQTRAETGCLARRQHYGTIATLDSNDAFWVLLLHCVLDKRAIAPHHRARLQELLEAVRTDSELGKAIEAVCPPGWTPTSMMRCVALGEWPALERLAPSLTKTWMRRDSIGIRQLIVQRGLRLVERLADLRRRRGLSVALVGPDGAGKSTLGIGVRSSFIFPVRLVYMGLTGGLLRHIGRLHVPGLVLIGRLLVLWCRYLMAQYHQLRGRLVVFDRYIYDAMVPHPDRLSWFRRASRWVDGRSCPAPDLVLVLNAPGEVMYERKGEYTPEQLEDWRQHFLALQRRIPWVETVDTTQTKDAARIEVIDRIWRRYVARWRKI